MFGIFYHICHRVLLLLLLHISTADWYAPSLKYQIYYASQIRIKFEILRFGWNITVYVSIGYQM